MTKTKEGREHVVDKKDQIIMDTSINSNKTFQEIIVRSKTNTYKPFFLFFLSFSAREHNI